MAIAFENTVSAYTGSGTSVTVAHAAGASGRKAILVILSTLATPTAVTVDGVAATAVRATLFTVIAGSIYYFDSPPSGSVNYVATQAATDEIEIGVLIYSGMATGGADSSADNIVVDTTLTVTTTVVASGCWLTGLSISSGSLPAAGTGTTVRTGATDTRIVGADSNATVGTGSQSLQFTTTPASAIRGVIASFTTGATVDTAKNLSLLGVGT